MILTPIGPRAAAMVRAAALSFLTLLLVAASVMLVSAARAEDEPEQTPQTIGLDADAVNKTAKSFSNHTGCENLEEIRSKGHDIWHFTLPETATFVSITVTFKKTDGTEVAITVKSHDDDTGMIDPNGDHDAYVIAPGGGTLVKGTAEILGTKPADGFGLQTTCPAMTLDDDPTPSTSPSTTPSTSASASTSTSPSTSPSASGEPSPSTGTSPSTSVSMSPSASNSDGVSPTPSGTQAAGGGGTSGGGLPTTGVALTGIALIALFAIGGGVALVLLARRRAKGGAAEA